MEACFPRKAHAHTGTSTTFTGQRFFLRSVTKCKKASNFDHLWPVSHFYPSGFNTFTCDFTSYFVKTVPGALNSFPLPMSLPFCFAERTLRGIHLYSSLPLNMIHSKTISAPAFRIIALAQTPTIEILPLD